MIKVSICCITFNHEPYIRQCLDGFLMQQCDFEYEILIHDDASTDGSPDIIKEYESKYPNVIKPIYRTSNLYSQGVRTINRFNFERASGEYIALCEGDDYWTDPYKLQRQVELLENNPDIVFCSHNVNRVNADNDLIQKSEGERAIAYYQPNEIIHNFFPTLSLVFRNVDLGYTENLRNAFNGDAVLTSLLSLHGGAAHAGFVGANYRVHKKGVFSRNTYLVNLKKSIETRKMLIGSSKFPEDIVAEIRKDIKRRKYKATKYCVKRFKFLTLLKFILK